MLVRTLQQPRRAIILLVVLALITLFASIGVAFVYFAEQEATKSIDQKAGETVKLPDSDILYSYVMKQIVYPTNNTASVLFTHSLIENEYGRTGVVPYSGTGPRPRLYRDNRPGVVDPQLAAGYTTNAGLIGQDELFRINRAIAGYNELLQGSLNPTYTYPDHKNAYLGGVAANWTDMNGNQHGPVAVARSFAREMKFRVAVIDTTIGAGLPNVIRYQDVIINPFSVSDYSFWRTVSDPTIALTTAEWQNFYVKRIALPPVAAPQAYAATAGVTAARPVLPPPPGTPVIQCSPDGTIAYLVMDALTCRAHTLRPDPRSNPNFPPPGDPGGDVKNLPPEVKTLVGFNGTAPVFANNDSIWMDLGFPAIPWSNNRRIKPMFAVTIIDLDGKVNMNTDGNLRGADPVNGTYHTSAHGLIPGEINPRKLYPNNPPLAAQMDQEIRQLLGGMQLTQNQFLRGRNGIDPNTGLAVDPSTLSSNTGYPPFGNFSLYAPILRPAPYYSGYNVDGTFDNFVNPPIPNYTWSPAFTLPGQSLAYGRFPANNMAPQGYANGFTTEYFRNTAPRSPLFSSPFAPTQPNANFYSNNLTSSQRTFGLYNAEAMYRVADTGGDKLDSDLRKLMPIAFSDARIRWQMTPTSMDLNAAGVAPWFNSNTGDSLMPRITPPAPPGSANLDSNPARPAGPSRQLPWTPPFSAAPPNTPQGEFVAQGPPATSPSLWRSIFGNTDRIDLTKQLPDYPLPVNTVTGLVDPNAHLDMVNPVVRAQYLIALQARQKLVDQIFGKLVYLTHPDITAGPTSMNAPRWLAQLAVNIVDYIDNDDYPTWYQVPTLTLNPVTNAIVASPSTLSTENFVWGTELPRLVINEVYAEALNSTTTTSPMGNTIADAEYHVRHWVELYNPLHDVPFAAWPDRANARLTVNGSSAYRLVISPQINVENLTNPATGIRGNPANRMGYPINTNDNKTNVVLFNGTTPANVTIPPSGANYGPLVPPDTANGFYLVAPSQGPPLNTDPMSTFPTMATNPNNMYESPQMQVDQRIVQGTTAFTDNQDNRQAILLQRLANPYLPHNPMPGPNTTFPTETPHNPLLPYNPYITIDYVEHITPNHAVAHTTQDSPSNADMTPVDQRSAIGKLQPYAALHRRPANAQLAKLQWTTQTPDRDLTVAGIDALQNQVQHTFFRHNSIEDTNPQYGQRAGGATRSASANTIQLPFDWLVHLDRTPVSPAELLHVSGYRPHELTQTFHNMMDRPIASGVDTIPPTPGPTLNLTPGTNLRFTATGGSFIGSLQGIPFTLKLNDLVYVTYITNPGGTQVSHWVRVNNIDPNYAWFDAEYNSPNTTVVDKSGFAKFAVPFAHTAPWYRATENVPIHSSNRIYRLLETLAVRNPGIDIGQVRFQGIGVGPLQADGSRWIQLNNQAGIPGMPLVATNDALLGLDSGTPAAMQLPVGAFPINQPTYAPFIPATPAYPDRVGDSVVFYAGTPSEQRAMVLEVNWQTNQIRTVLPVVPPLRTFTVDYTYHSGRQPGKINLNTLWDLESFLALADVKTMNAFFHDPKAIAPNAPPPIVDREALVKLAFQRLYQQRQPGYFYIPRLVGHTGINNVGEDRPLQGMGTGDIAPDVEIPRQGIGNTLLSDRHQEGPNGYANLPLARSSDMTQPVPFEAAAPMAGTTPIYSTPERMLSTLFEMYRPHPVVPAAPVVPTFLPDPGMNHPYRRFELLSKIWNNTTTRSNTFAVWVTVGFFEYDEATGIGAELGQTTGKNVRHRFFSVVDRSSIDGWLKSWQMWDSTASVDRFANTNQFPTLDPRDLTFKEPPVISSNFGPVAGTGNVWQITIMPEFGNPYFVPGLPPTFHFGQLVDVEGLDGAGNPISERTMLLDPTPAPNTYSMRHVYPPQYPTTAAIPQQQLFVRLTKNYVAGTLTVRSVPIPPTVLHWSQLK